MHDIWNPWHGCVRISPGCANCYMYTLDQQRGKSGADIYRTNNFNYPLQRDRYGNYKIKSGELIRVCMTSDFFLEEADQWRADAWEIMRQRPDVIFYLLTKRPERVANCLPDDFGNGWENIWFNVTCENQQMANKRLPYLKELPFRHKGVMCAPLIGPVSLLPYLDEDFIEQVICGGENYAGSRPCNYDWVLALHDECRKANVSFSFIEIGSNFVKDGRHYHLGSKQKQAEQAFKAGLNYVDRPQHFDLHYPIGIQLQPHELYQARYDGPHCHACGSRLICNGCSHCGKCGGDVW
ncbi:putative phage Gp37Gp68 family protein (plasmid) [Selenomonas ruminantium subsp. lactilytica TAM6421]|uniref:Putative phage Gp37Gp68 family protein n=1 Tax=Selenomonas ruminantium subsp. lactilytica (strain NBRC 103574 / TAM6421) TaxID=927704 RepID=I0GV56_SELRL|nr:DUF5131 family protein [Selenomonas ruminantium]BAL84643.1 putative phage Gp37Gp68 family protein [Selenomonas ruminantium subsp. lactilytica TAM6421]